MQVGDREAETQRGIEGFHLPEILQLPTDLPDKSGVEDFCIGIACVRLRRLELALEIGQAGFLMLDQPVVGPHKLEALDRFAELARAEPMIAKTESVRLERDQLRDVAHFRVFLSDDLHRLVDVAELLERVELENDRPPARIRWQCRLELRVEISRLPEFPLHDVGSADHGVRLADARGGGVFLNVVGVLFRTRRKERDELLQGQPPCVVVF